MREASGYGKVHSDPSFRLQKTARERRTVFAALMKEVKTPLVGVDQ